MGEDGFGLLGQEPGALMVQVSLDVLEVLNGQPCRRFEQQGSLIFYGRR